MVLNRVSYPPCSLSQPWLKLYSYHDSQWLETNKNMNETSAKSFNNWCQIFWKFIFELEDFSYSIRMGLSLAKQSKPPQKMLVINKIHYFNFLVYCLYTFNLLSLSLKWAMILVATTYRKIDRGKFCKITKMVTVKGSETRPFILIFRLNIVLCD